MSRRIPPLETARLIVRELRLEDLDAIHRVLNRAFGLEISLAEHRRWLEWTVLGYEMFSMLQQPHYGERAVEMKETGEVIGAVGIVPYLDTFNRVAAFGRPENSPATAEVGLFWAVDPAYQGKGYAPEAARSVMEYLFAHENLGRIIATTGDENLASQRVMEKLGMTIHRLDPPQMPDQFVVGVIQKG